MSYNTHLPLEEIYKSAMCMQNIVQTILLSFLQQEIHVLCQQDNAHHHVAHVTHYALQVVQRLPKLP